MSLQVDFPPVALDPTPKPRRTNASTDARKSTGRHSANGSGVEGEENGVVMHIEKVGCYGRLGQLGELLNYFQSSQIEFTIKKNIGSELHLK